MVAEGVVLRFPYERMLKKRFRRRAALGVPVEALREKVSQVFRPPMGLPKGGSFAHNYLFDRLNIVYYWFVFIFLMLISCFSVFYFVFSCSFFLFRFCFLFLSLGFLIFLTFIVDMSANGGFLSAISMVVMPRGVWMTSAQENFKENTDLNSKCRLHSHILHHHPKPQDS